MCLDSLILLVILLVFLEDLISMVDRDRRVGLLARKRTEPIRFLRGWKVLSFFLNVMLLNLLRMLMLVLELGSIFKLCRILGVSLDY